MMNDVSFQKDKARAGSMMNDAGLQKDKTRDESIENLMDLLRNATKPFRFSCKDLNRFTSNFVTEIGSDMYGRVYKGQLPTDVDVAVKVLLVQNVEERTFMMGVDTINRMYHRNLVKLYGFCFDDNMKALVWEYMENGSLDKCLYENHLNFNWEKFYDIAVGIASALSYLHVGCEEQIIYYDFKPSNVLLDAKLSPKIVDFGMAMIVKLDHFGLARNVNRFDLKPSNVLVYAAPETYIQSSEWPITAKCDVYSFGIMLFEILGISNKQSKDWFPRQVWKKLQNGHLNELIMDCGITEENREKASILCLIALWCVQLTPQNRPSMKTVVNMLRREIHAVPIPPNPFRAVNLSGLAFSHELIYSKVSPAIDRIQDKEKLGESVVDSISQELPL